MYIYGSEVGRQCVVSVLQAEDCQLQCVAVCCSVLQCVADMILRVASVYTQGVAGCCSVLQCAEVCQNSYRET